MQKAFFISSYVFLSAFVTSVDAVLPIYPAEIIGRDLNTPGVGMLGHVGVTMAPFVNQDAYQVIEVLNENPVVQLNTIDNFKTRSPYWGSRYGIADRSIHAVQLLREGNAQRCLGAEYTITSISSAATGDIRNYPNCTTTRVGKFRCDTFVNYIFSVGGYNTTQNGKTAPNIVFYAFPYGNGDGPKALQSISPIDTIIKPPLISILNSIASVTAEELEEMNSEEFMEIIDVPRNNATNETIEKIWDLSLNSTLNIERRIVLMDYLGGLAKIDMIPNFIAQYPKINDPGLQSMLLRDIQDVYQEYLPLNENLNEKELLQKFYSQLLNKDLSPQDTERVVRGFISLHSNEVILANINIIDSLLNKINPYTRIGLKTNLSLKIKELEPTVIPDIINLLKSQNDAQLDERFFLYVIDNLSRGIDRLDSELKNIISSYLDSVKYKYDNNKRSINRNASMLSYGAWLEASALVNSSTLKEAGRYVAKFLKSLNTINEQESYVIGLSSRAYMKNAFKTELVLIGFKKQREAIYLNTVGMLPHK